MASSNKNDPIALGADDGEQSGGEVLSINVRINTTIPVDSNEQHIPDVVQFVKRQFEDPWTPIRQHMLHMFKVKNLRIDRCSNSLKLDISFSHSSDVHEIINGYKRGDLQRIFSDCIRTFPPVKLLVDIDEGAATAVAGRLARFHQLPVTYIPNEAIRRGKIVADVVKKKLADKNFSPSYLFHILLNEFGKVDFSAVKTDGRNILHMIVESSRPEFFETIVYLNLWGSLNSQFIDSGQYVDYNPRGLAEQSLTRRNGPKTLEEYDHFELLWHKMPQLHKECLRGSLAGVKTILAVDLDINQKDGANATAILYACANGSSDVIRLLIERGADPFLTNSYGENCLILAAKFGKLAVIELLFGEFREKCHLNKNQVDISKNRAIDHAVINGDFRTVKALADGGILPDGRDLSLAVKYNRQDMTKLILKKYAFSLNGVDNDGRTPLLNAVRSGNLEVVDICLDLGAKLTDCDNQKRNCFHFLAESNHHEALERIIKAAREGSCLDKLLNDKDNFCDGDQLHLVRGRDRGRRAWHYVQIKRNLYSLYLTRMRSGEIDVTKFGKISASGFGLSPMKKEQLQVQAHLTENRPDRTPLLLAAWESNNELARILVEAGANVNETDTSGASALHVAAMRGNIELAQYLLANGAQLTCKDNDNRTPAKVAYMNEHHSLCNFIKDKEYIQIAATLLAGLKTRQRSLFNCGGMDMTNLVLTCKNIKEMIRETLVKLDSSHINYESRRSVRNREVDSTQDILVCTPASMPQLGEIANINQAADVHLVTQLTDVYFENAHVLEEQ